MCQANNRFIFCSCSDKNEDPSTDELTVYYIWTLIRYLGSKESRIRGKIMMPTKDLGNGITLDAICEQLNSDLTTFDFDYEPSERDSLSISIIHPIERYMYFKLIFIDRQWQQGSNNIFTSVTEEIASGNIKRHVNFSQEDQWITVTKDTITSIFKKIDEEANMEMRWKLIRELIDRKPEEAFSKAKTFIVSDAHHQRMIGCEILVKLYYSDYESSEIFILFFDILKLEDNEEIISLILNTLDSINKNFSEQQIEFLCKFKNYRDDVKLNLMDAFSWIENEKVIDVLIEFSKDKNYEVRETAVSKLGNLTESANVKLLEALWNSVHDKNKEVRHTAILALSERKEEDLKDILLKELQKIDGQGRLILDAIENLNDKSFIPHIEFQIQKHKNSANYLTKLLQNTLDDLNSAT
ncbi:HEAT repeat domain-containing protein [uncultured Kordia sp.]|uniref:HEAT repeat domain-containing protein n=1 Tax=uncultured Kordia sp. TaxID=507699 RepID=UPI00261654EC|nr:HEAT repeat domain-containing protein [uncultured Kordia sp.]